MIKIIRNRVFITLAIFVFLLSASARADSNKPKYVFYFIGDGMGLSHVYSAELYLNSNNNTPVLENRTKLSFSQFPTVGIATNYCANSTITDSAAAGTALATGEKTAFGVISMDQTKTIKFTTMAEIAKASGKKVGIISSCNLDDATPACFYAHEAGRGSSYNIALQMISSKFDYFAGGGISCGPQTDIYNVLAANGITLARTKDEFNALVKVKNQRVYAFDANPDEKSTIYYNIDQKGGIALAEFTQKGIDLLNNSKGFFMMIEGGKIDLACHNNDAAAAIKEILAFDEAVQVAVNFYKKHKSETLIVVTADHETGGFATGYSETRYSTYLERLNNQTMSFVEFNKIIKNFKASADPETAKLEMLSGVIQSAFGLKIDTFSTTDSMCLSDYEYLKLDEAFQKSILNEPVFPTPQEYYVAYGGYEPITTELCHILDNKAGIGWTTYSHSASPPPLFAIGVKNQNFAGYQDNTDIAKKLIKLIKK